MYHLLQSAITHHIIYIIRLGMKHDMLMMTRTLAAAAAALAAG
jgi:hypothetical protein